MTCRPSKALLLAAVLAAAYAPVSRGEEAAVVLDAKNGEISSTPSVGVGGASPIEFLQNNSPSLVLASTFPTPELHSEFEEWTVKFERAYKTMHDGALRKLIWLENHALIEGHNGQSPAASYSMSHNDFSDLTNDEFRQRNFLGEYSPGIMKPKGRSDGSWLPSSPGRKLLRSDIGDLDESDADEATVVDVPDSKNWKDEGAVTKVKNQWLCGACWAYSAVGAIEGIRYIATGNLTELSMQQLIDCDKTDMGCGGGLMDQAFAYEDTVGLCALEEYPMAYHRHWLWGCSVGDPSPASWWHNANCQPLPDTKVQKFVDIESTELALKAAIATQPVSVAVEAGSWQFYHEGIMDKGCEAQIDHGVLAVGYGHDDASVNTGVESGGAAGDYWLIKNSWGEGWGQNGYIQLARGIGNEATNGTSCILTLASRPIMKVED